MTHPTHKTRMSDASSFDEICALCGCADRAGDDGLDKPCSAAEGAMTDQPRKVDTRSAVQRVASEAYSRTIKSLAAIVLLHDDDHGRIARDPVMQEVQRLRDDADVMMKAHLSLRSQADAREAAATVYLTDGKAHQLCDCDNREQICPRYGHKRTLYTAGFSQCMVPTPGATAALHQSPAPQEVETGGITSPVPGPQQHTDVESNGPVAAGPSDAELDALIVAMSKGGLRHASALVTSLRQRIRELETALRKGGKDG